MDMEKVLELQNEINILLNDYREKNALIREKESFVAARRTSINSEAEADKYKIKVQLQDLQKDVQAIWYKVKEQCRKAGLSFNVDEFKSEHLKVDEEDPLSTINTMLERFESEMQSIQSAYDITPMTAFNANGLIYLIQRYIASNLSDIENAYWGDARKDKESAKALDEIREIENLLADIVDQIFFAYAELKVEVERINSVSYDVEGPVYKQTRVFASKAKIALGVYRHIKKDIEFDTDETPLDLKTLYVYGNDRYELMLGNNETNDATMFIINDESIRESFLAFIKERVKESYPEDATDIVTDLYDLNIPEENDVISYNIAHSESPIHLSFAIVSEIEGLDQQFLKGQAFIVLVVNEEESKKYQDVVSNIIDVRNYDDGFDFFDYEGNKIYS